MKQVKQIKDFLQKKGNGFLLWGLTICLFFLYSLNKDDISRAWQSVLLMPKIHQNMDSIKVQISTLDTTVKVRTVIIKKEIARVDAKLDSHSTQIKMIQNCIKSVIESTINVKTVQDSILENLVVEENLGFEFPKVEENIYICDTNQTKTTSL